MNTLNVSPVVEYVIDILFEIYRSIGELGIGIIFLCILSSVILVLLIKRYLNPFKNAEKSYEKGDDKKALNHLLIELNKNPLNKKALLLKAHVLVRLENFSDAERDYYRLIFTKKPGDGIEVIDLKKRLLLTLYRQEKTQELFVLSKEIIDFERNNPEALYYLGIIYLGHLYYGEALKILERVIQNRPHMHEALFAYCITLSQLREFEKSLEFINRAIAHEECKLYRLTRAGIFYLMGNYKASLDILKSIPQREREYDSRRQYLFYLRLNAYCYSMIGLYENSIKIFRFLYRYKREIENVKKKRPGLYDQFGRQKKSNPEKKDKKKEKEKSILDEYFRLKEVAIDAGKESRFSDRYQTFTSRFLDIEGLSPETQPALDLAFSMVRAGLYSNTRNLIKEVKDLHPEVIGLHKILNLIEEKEKDKAKPDTWNLNFLKLRETTERVIEKKNRRYELWEYLAHWEDEAIKPYHLLLVSGFSLKKKLSPLFLFNRDGGIDLDF